MKRIRRLLAQPETPRSALTPVFSAAILTVTAVAVLAAWQTKQVAPPLPPARASAPLPLPAGAPVPQLPAAPRPLPAPLLAQTQQTPEALPAQSPYRKWLNEDVAYIITDEERAAFKGLGTDAEREHFIEQFWLRRDPTPGTPANEFKEEHYRRIAYANQKFAAAIPGWKTDRGRIYIVYGPPDEKESHPSGGKITNRRTPLEGASTTTTFPLEQWLYHYIEGVGKDVIIDFIDPANTGEYHQSADPNGKDALLNIPRSPAKRLATVQVLGSSAAISIALGAYQDHRVSISGRIFTKENVLVKTFEDSSQDPSPNPLRTIPLPVGLYRLEVIVKDLATDRIANETTEFWVR